MRYEDFIKYCEWIFSFSSLFENKIPYEHYFMPQSRVIGYMAERIINIYVKKHKMKAKYLNIYRYDGTKAGRKGLLKTIFINFVNFMQFLRCEITFNFIITLKLERTRKLIRKIKSLLSPKA